VTSSAQPPTDDAMLAEAMASYQRYVRSQTEALLVRSSSTR
jgi:hypothetical protein